MHCTKCGTEIAPGAQFCKGCGTSVDTIQAMMQAKKSTPIVSKPIVTLVIVFGIFMAVLFGSVIAVKILTLVF